MKLCGCHLLILKVAFEWALSLCVIRAEPLPREKIELFVLPPISLNERLNDEGVWQLLISGGQEAGYVFETEPTAPLLGFAGTPINAVVVLDLEGQILPYDPGASLKF